MYNKNFLYPDLRPNFIFTNMAWATEYYAILTYTNYWEDNHFERKYIMLQSLNLVPLFMKEFTNMLVTSPSKYSQFDIVQWTLHVICNIIKIRDFNFFYNFIIKVLKKKFQNFTICTVS